MSTDKSAEDEIAAIVVEDALKLIKGGAADLRTLLKCEEKWLSIGVSPETCKVARLLAWKLNGLGEAQPARAEDIADLLVRGIRLSQELFATPNNKPLLPGLAPLSMTRPAEATAKPVVMVIHGIKTAGSWMDDIAQELKAAGFKAEVLNYDIFGARQLLWKPSRRKKVDWLLREYERVRERNDGIMPSIVAHSFGTYLVTNAMSIYRLKFDRIIFCGAIVSPDYSWKTMFGRGLVNGVLNDYGKRDFWAWIVGWVVEDAGQAGYVGFNDLADGKVIQIEHPEFRHSDFFFLTNYRNSWIPFLHGEGQREMEPDPANPWNWRFAIVFWFIGGATLALLAYLVYRYFWK